MKVKLKTADSVVDERELTAYLKQHILIGITKHDPYALSRMLFNIEGLSSAVVHLGTTRGMEIFTQITLQRDDGIFYWKMKSTRDEYYGKVVLFRDDSFTRIVLTSIPNILNNESVWREATDDDKEEAEEAEEDMKTAKSILDKFNSEVLLPTKIIQNPNDSVSLLLYAVFCNKQRWKKTLTNSFIKNIKHGDETVEIKYRPGDKLVLKSSFLNSSFSYVIRGALQNHIINNVDEWDD